MKKSLTDLIQFRLSRADETMEEAKQLARTEHWNGVVNRLYYAAFYAVSALMITKDFYTKKHSGLRSKFNEEIIKKGTLPSNFGNTYNILFDSRTSGDYADFVVFEKEQVVPLIDSTVLLINEIKKLITDDSFTN